MAGLKKGDAARVRPVVVAGTFEGRRFDPDTGELLGERLAWTGADGEAHVREFPPGTLEPDPDAPPAAAQAEAPTA